MKVSRALGLEPVIMALGRWAARSPKMPFASPISVTSLIIAFRTMFDPEAAAGFKASLELRLGEEMFQARIVDGVLELERGHVDQPDAVIEGDTETLKALAFGGWPVDEAVQTGTLTVTGDQALGGRFFKVFKLPVPVAPATSA